MSRDDSDDESDQSEDLTDVFQAILSKITSKEETDDDDPVKLLRELPEFKESCLHICKSVTKDDMAYKYITTYIENSQDHGFKISVQNIVRVTRSGDYEFEHNPKLKNRFRLMLWHGTTAEGVANILNSGFRKPNAKGQMFGTGIYFADRASKSARYCFGGAIPLDPPKNSVAYLLLCDVFIGQAYNAKNAHSEYKTAPAVVKKEFDSVKCTGEIIPDIKDQIQFEGAKWPIGKSVKNSKFPSYALRFNEFVIYNTDHVKIKYVVKVKFE